MAWTVEQKSTNQADSQSAEEAKIKLIIFNQTLRLQPECKLRIMHHVLFAQKLYEYVAKASKNLCNFLVFFFSSIFCVTNFEFVTENQMFSLPPQREREKMLELDALGSSVVEIVFSQNSIETSIILFLHQLFIKYVLYIYGFENLMWAVA